MQQIKRSAYRQRVFKAADGSINLVFGSDSAPVEVDGTPMVLLADHDVVDSIVIEDHVETAT